MIDISLEEGYELIKKSIPMKTSTEIVTLENALGRILAKKIYSKYDNPPFNRSPIDGYCCHSSDIEFASKDTPVTLKVIGELNAGDSTEHFVKKGECIRIMTGAEIPDDCDCCIKQEDTDYGDTNVKIYKSVGRHYNYCFKGEDVERNTLVLDDNIKITYAEIGIIASLGIDRVEVLKMPRITILSTGDEVLLPSDTLTKSKIFNSNIFLIEARLKELGFIDIQKYHIADDAHKVYEKIKELYSISDVIITTGGVSVGKKDIFHEVVKLQDFQQIFWKLKIQPGTPIMYSKYKDLPVISLSGNPFASIVNFELVVRQILYLLYKDESVLPLKTTAVLQNAFNKKTIKRRFIRGKYVDNNVFINEDGHSSGVISSLRGCNALVEVRAYSDKMEVGEVVSVVLL